MIRLHKHVAPFLLAGVVALGLGWRAELSAAPIHFQIDGTATGSLDGTPFTDVVFSVSIDADTVNVDTTTFGAEVPAYTGLTGTITLAGLGIATFTEPLYVFNNQFGEILGFGNPVNHDLISVSPVGAGLDTYGLTTSIGPLALDVPYSNAQFTDVATSLGLLTLDTITEGSFAVTTAAVPEPGATAMLLGAAGFGCLFARRRRTAPKRSATV